MKVFSGCLAVTLIGLVSSQGLERLLSLLHGPSRRFQLRRGSYLEAPRLNQQYNLDIHDADHVNLVPSARTSARASASSSLGLTRGLAGGLEGLRLNDFLRSGLLAGHVGIQPQTRPNIAVRRSSAIVRPRRTFIVGQNVPTGSISVPSQIASAGIPPGASTMMFDTPDRNTPDTPDLVYAPRSIMGDINQIEALRNRAEADGVVFV